MRSDRGPADLCGYRDRNARGRKEVARQCERLAHRAIRRIVICRIFALLARRGGKTHVSRYGFGRRNGSAGIEETLSPVNVRLREAILENERNHEKKNEERPPRRDFHPPVGCDCHNSEASIHGRYSHLGAL